METTGERDEGLGQELRAGVAGHAGAMRLARTALLAVLLVLFGACGPCGGATGSSSGGDGCAHPGLCLTITGPLAGSTSGLVSAPDCIPGGGLDAVFTTNLGGRETTIEILVTDDSAKSSPGFHPGAFKVRPRGATVQGTGYASIWVKPDSDVSGYRGGWSTDGPGSSGTVVIDSKEGGLVNSAVVAPTAGSGSSLHVSGTFHCQ